MARALFDALPAAVEAPAPPRPARVWAAELSLRLERRGDRTVLAHAHHRGPLRVQKALYPETEGRADVLILHPPAGIAGGDHLSLHVELTPGAQARITTPGAAKWYRASGRAAFQDTHLKIADGAVLEWLPQEAIAFDGAQPCTRTDIDCTKDARGCGWDLWMLGRLAAGETFASGELRQRTRLRRDGRLLWSERIRLAADDPLRRSPLGWNDAGVIGSFWIIGLPNDESLLASCREIAEPGVQIGITRFEHGLWIARALGHSAEKVRTALTRIWSQVRPTLCGATGVPPRIWAT
ncbi:urease accessory protein UreD [Panacagrimonas perspica]|uniref:urease accessory protein UreD n=1 Tax=Panacagrimonas perspica TaxID=381431 RepID=UPI00144747C3|nr:urease accessory protein UreD [Panacagrimonas perspica]